MTLAITTRSVSVHGARLHYEIRGSGPLLLVIGSPMAAAEFAPLADALASDHTVVTYDPRGYAGSTIDDPDETPPRSRAPTTSTRSSTTSAPSRPTCSVPAAGR